MKGKIALYTVVLISGASAGLFLAQESQSDRASGTVKIEEVAGATVYKLTGVGKINVRDLRLVPHYRPSKKNEGWKHAFVELSAPSMERNLVEEIPANSRKLIGRHNTSIITLIAVAGRGYTEFRTKKEQEGQGVWWDAGDVFFVRINSWYGHANPFDEPGRLLTVETHLDEDLLNPFLGRIRSVPEQLFPGEDWKSLRGLGPTSADDVFELRMLQKHPAKGPQHKVTENPILRASGERGGRIISGPVGTKFNMAKMEFPGHHLRHRREDGWLGGLVGATEAGYRSSIMVVQQIPPKSKEIGHKHWGGATFLGVKGKGYTAFRAYPDSQEVRVEWGEFDLFEIPWLTAGGTWHSHCNPYDEPARFMTTGGVILEDELLELNKGGWVGSFHAPTSENDATFRERQK